MVDIVPVPPQGSTLPRNLIDTMKAHARFHQPSAVDSTQATDLLGSDGVLWFDGRKNLAQHVVRAQARMQWLLENQPHHRVTGFTIFHGHRLEGCRVLYREGGTPG